jgi:hypothetical protein
MEVTIWEGGQQKKKKKKNLINRNIVFFSVFITLVYNLSL